VTGTNRIGRVLLALVIGAAIVFVNEACVSERAVTAPLGEVDCRLPLGPKVAGSTVIVIRDFAFEPASVSIKAGASVTWLNCSTPDDPAHTTTADQSQWNSPLLSEGETFTETFDAAGSYAYHCEPHPFMKGSVEVEP
jgi:plastocyanin